MEKFENIDKIIVTGGNPLGCLWAIGWLFTIGYLKLSFWQGVLGIIIWPYYLGKHFYKPRVSNEHH